MINYQAQGELLSCAFRDKSVDDVELYWVLVELHGRPRGWVISAYLDGSKEWLQGHYFHDFKKAQLAFASFVACEAVGEVPACDWLEHVKTIVKVSG